MNENKNAHKDIATTPRPQMAASGRLDFISFRIAQKSYTIYKMSPRTTARIIPIFTAADNWYDIRQVVLARWLYSPLEVPPKFH